MKTPLRSSPGFCRVLIASASPLFRAGLRKVCLANWGAEIEILVTTSSMQETLKALETYQPDLVIVDYDDGDMNSGSFLSGFVSGENPMRLALVSLRAAETVILYERHHLTSAEAEAWLLNPWGETRMICHQGE